MSVWLQDFGNPFVLWGITKLHKKHIFCSDMWQTILQSAPETFMVKMCLFVAHYN